MSEYQKNNKTRSREVYRQAILNKTGFKSWSEYIEHKTAKRINKPKNTEKQREYSRRYYENTLKNKRAENKIWTKTPRVTTGIEWINEEALAKI